MCVRVRARVQLALLILHATCMRHIVTSFVALSLHHICRHYLINGAIFEKKIEHETCILIFTTAFV
jgi:hypothetical protein